MGSGARRQQFRQARLSRRAVFPTLSGGHPRRTHTPMSAMPRDRGAGAHRQGKGWDRKDSPHIHTDTLTPDTQAHRKRQDAGGHRDGVLMLTPRTETYSHAHRRGHGRTPERPSQTAETHTHEQSRDTGGHPDTRSDKHRDTLKDMARQCQSN